MMNKLKNWRMVVVMALLAVGTMVVLGAGRNAPPVIQTPGEGEQLVPRVQIIQFDDSVARFDTTTGEIHRYHGELDKANVRGQWVRHVRGVSGDTSGLLQLQKPRGVRAEEALFLVDVITGDTWLLRRRGANADWDKIEMR